MITTVGATCIGTNADTAFTYSTTIGSNIVCTADHQIMLGTVNESVVVPANLSVNGSTNIISKNVLGYLSNASSNTQSQINTVSSNLASVANNPTPSTLSVYGLGTLNQAKINTSLQVLQNISFSGTLNNISTTTFFYLSGLTNNIQNQINAIANRTPVGSVIQFAGIATDITGYLPCDGTQYNSYKFPALFNVIQYTYGGDQNQQVFKLPNYNNTDIVLTNVRPKIPERSWSTAV